jgi:hypothetical protein
MKSLFVCGFLLIGEFCFAQKLMPRLHLLKGETYYLTSDGTSATLQAINGRENKITISTKLKLAFKVAAVKDSIYLLDGNYQSIDTKIIMADTTLKMSSVLSAKADTPSVILSGIINKPFEITLSNSGKVHSIGNISEIIDKAVKSFKDIDSIERRKISALFEQSFGETVVKGLMQSGAAVFPASPVSKNETWTVTNVVATPAKMKQETVYRISGDEGDFYQVYGDGTMTTDSLAATADFEGMPVKYEMTGNTLIDVQIDKKTGWIKEVKSKQQISGKMTILKNTRLPEGMIIPMIFTTEITISGK